MASELTTDNLTGQKVPNLPLSATDGTHVDLGALSGVTVVYAYPRTSPPDQAPIEAGTRYQAHEVAPLSQKVLQHITTLSSRLVLRVFSVFQLKVPTIKEN